MGNEPHITDSHCHLDFPDFEGRLTDVIDAAAEAGRFDVVAQLALFLCSDEAAFITGAAYPIDGGFMSLL